MKILKYNFLGLILLFIFALVFVEAKNQSMHQPQYELLENSRWALAENQKQEFDELVKNLNHQANFLSLLSGYRSQIQQLKSLPFVQNAYLSWKISEPVRIHAKVSDVKAMMRKDGQWFLLGPEGKILKTVDKSQTLDLPIISSETVLKDPKLRQKTFNLFDALESSETILTLKQVSEVSVDERGLYFIFSPGYRIYLSEENFKTQLQRLHEVLKYLEMKKIDVKFIDSQFKNKIIVRPQKKKNSEKKVS